MPPDSVNQPGLRAACVRHLGAYHLIGEAFGRLERIATAAGLVDPDTHLIAIYYDDPEAIPQADLRSDAGLVVPDDRALPSDLAEVDLPEGRYLRARHEGPYDTLPAAWARLKEAGRLGTGNRRRVGPSYEVYLNTPMTAAPEELLTEIFIPVE